MTTQSSETRSSESQAIPHNLTWRDGFALTLVIPMGIFATLGPLIGSIGSGAVAALYIACGLLAMLQNFFHAEMASMFPDKAGGIPLYAHEAWKRYLPAIGSVVTFGYWAGWAFSNAVYALLMGQLLQGEFFPSATWSISTGTSHLGLAGIIGVATLIVVWLLNAYGVRQTALMNKILGALVVLLIVILVVLPLIEGKFHASGVTWGLTTAGPWHGWRLVFAFMFVFAWTTYGTEAAAVFTPEYRTPRTDTPKALVSSGAFTVIVAVALTLGVGGTLTDKVIAADSGSMYAQAFAKVVGSASAVITILLAAALFVIMNSCTAVAGRALYALAKDDMTIKQFNHLNSRGLPARAMLADLVLNSVMIVFVGNTLGIIFASNIGYMVATVMVLAGFVLLRRDRPDWPRPIRVPGPLVPLAAVLALVNAVFLVVAFLYPGDAGYGGTAEQIIGVGVLLASLALYAYRRLVQDRDARTKPEIIETSPTASG